MARYIEQGKSIFIPFHKGVSITDSQLHLRMYKTEEMFERHFPPHTEYDVLCEYAPVVRCKDCKHYMLWEDSEDKRTCAKSIGLMISDPDDFCSYGERRTDV
jgi:hypothetical protein